MSVRPVTPAPRRAATTTLLAVATLLLSTVPSAAQTTSVAAGPEERVIGEVTHQALTVTLPNGDTARGNLLRFPETAAGVELRPRLGQGTIAGLQRFDSMAKGQLARGAVAGINGGYFLPRPWGAPNGLFVDGGRMSSGQAVNSNGRPTGRGMLGIRPDGRLLMDRLTVSLWLDQPNLPDVEPAQIDELDRATGTANIRPDGELLLFDDRYGSPIQVPAGSTVAVVSGLRVGTSGRSEGVVTAVGRPDVDTTYGVPAGHHALLAHGVDAGILAEVAVGHRLGVTSSVVPDVDPSRDWSGLRGGLPGGQLLMVNGGIRSSSEWDSFAAFGDGAHSSTRQPRTAVGRTAAGEALLLTVDGDWVNRSWSVGMTVGELAATMYRLGAVDAVNLDGGGSTAMAIGGRVTTRVSDPDRGHSTGLFVHVEPPGPARALDRACPPGEVPAGGFRDVPGTTHASSIDCLAWWQVTSGVTADRFVPGGHVTRGQMATFLAKWIDDVAARGDGRTLPTAASEPFTDVSDGHTHRSSIARLHQAGVISGTSPTTYAPNASVTRAQTASLVRKATEFITGAEVPASRDTFIDDNGSTHEQNIDRLAAVGVIGGTGGFDFTPVAPVSRGAMASLVMRASDLLVEQGRVGPPAR